jgi:phosphatidylglycerophosphatase C
MSLVFFDFDGTLTRRDSILPFGVFVASTQPARQLKIAHLLLLMTMLKSRMISNHVFKERLCVLLLKGQSEAAMDRIARAFAEVRLGRMLNDPMVEALRRHRQQHDDVYLVSSNFSLVLRPFERLWNAQGVIATDPEVVQGRFTGRILGRSCDGEEKLSRVLAAFGDERVRSATAYGDSRGDRPLLGYVKRAIWV